MALATVADVVPLVGENRSLVRRGLEELRLLRRPGMKALAEAAKCEPTRMDEGDLAFRLAPRINAAGRLYRADAGVELFLTDDPARAAEIAHELSRANGERRATEREVANEAETALRDLPDALREAPALVVAGEGWHPGVIGIVASRMVERHNRPTIVISLDGEGGGRGSGRSIPGFDLLAALEACAEHLTSFGGHRAAAGLALEAESLDAFREAFAAHAAEVLGPEDLMRTERIDAMVGGADLGLDLAEELGRLAPFGMGNPGVRLLVPGASVRDVRPMGQEGKHSRFNLHWAPTGRSGSPSAARSSASRAEDTVDAAVRLEVNHWNGAVEPRVVLRELYPHEAAQGEPDGAAEAEAEWWERFEDELAADPAAWPPGRKATARRGSSARPAGEGERAVCTVSGSAAATLPSSPRAAPPSSAWSPTCLGGRRWRGPAPGSPSTRSSNETPTWPRSSSTSSSSTRPPSRTSSCSPRAPRPTGRAICIPPGASPSAASRSPLSRTNSPVAGCSSASSATSATPERARAPVSTRRFAAAAPTRGGRRPRHAASWS